MLICGSVLKFQLTALQNVKFKKSKVNLNLVLSYRVRHTFAYIQISLHK